VLAVGAAHLATERVYLSQAAMDLDLARSGWIAAVTWGLYVFVSLALIARVVGYRVRDGLLAFVPFYGYYFPFKMLWRWAALPDRYWEDRLP
jgi:hypothetical protein